MYQPSSYYNMEAGEVITSLGSHRRGLSQAEARRRLAQFGPNLLVPKGKVSPWMLLLEQFKSFLIMILLVAVVLSAFLGEVVDAVIIGVIVLFAAGLGFIQEYRAERAMDALKRMAAPVASVLRDGNETEIPASDVVPGDVVILRTGDKVPADGRLIEAANLRTEEAPLTGESVPVEKVTHPIAGEAGVGDRKNMVFTGTAAVYGRGMAVVVATGMTTEFGKIATMLQEVKEEKTPLQINLDRMGRRIGIGALGLCFILAVLGVFRGHAILEMLIWGVSLAVAAVPEALPAVVTISLALGVQKMVRRHALIRKLSSVETLGSTTVICSDKTGTLTQDQMTVRQLYVDGKQINVTGTGYEPKGEFYVDNAKLSPVENPALVALLRIGALAGDTALVSEGDHWEIKGDPTEGALVVAAAKAGLLKEVLDSQFPREGEIPFSSETKRMTTVHNTPEGKLAYSKGAAEVILDSSRYVLAGGVERELTNKDREEILKAGQAMADDALRVIGLAYKRLPDRAAIGEDSERQMVFVGLAGMIDPPRPEVKEAVKVCDEAGIKTVMITGDHKLTAMSIARELGILKGGVAVTGAELDKMSDDELGAMVEKIDVYARVSPMHKLRVVEALTTHGHVVAMTGDGVNDAPALKKADIGVAMGITGTDVSKEAADMVLTDDNFTSIVAAVEEGRGIFANVKKYLMYLLSSNLGEILLMAGAILFGPLIGLPSGAIPLIAIQILWVNLATDGLPAIALSLDPPDADIMKEKPRPRGRGIFTRPVMVLIAIGGMWSALVNLGIFKVVLDSGRSVVEAQALCFVSLTLIQFFKAYNFRSDKHSIFRIGFFRNKWLNLAIVWELALLALLVYFPFLQRPFHTFSLGILDWAIVILAAGTIFPVLEVAKAIIRRRERRSSPATVSEDSVQV